MDDANFVSQQSFLWLLDLEQKRIERSGGRFVLLLLEAPGLFQPRSPVSRQVISSLCGATRETDIKGWYKEDSTCGIIFTEIASGVPEAIKPQLCGKISDALRKILPAEQIDQVRLSCYLLPDDRNDDGAPGDFSWLDAEGRERQNTLAHITKRCLDIAGSLILIVAMAPLLVAIAIAIKCSSPGPVLFRQTRQGRFGRPFTFLKFRSMYEKNDPHIHQEYMKRLIAGGTGQPSFQEHGASVYKLTNDPRITPVGRFLRRSSLDELPQVFNVLTGDMSLVGPRPPLSYEVENYAPWHRRRLRETKPGITGLWQVHGRSRTTFDEMVRLDLQYGRNWSLWLDVKILLRTPWAVLTGSGAY